MGWRWSRLEWILGRRERWVWSLAVLVVVGSLAWDAWQARHWRLADPVPALPGPTGGWASDEAAGTAPVTAPVTRAGTPAATATGAAAATATGAAAGVSSLGTAPAPPEMGAAVSPIAPHTALGAGTSARADGAARAPQASESAATSPSPEQKRATPGDRVDLNRAGLSELDALPGIGPALAERILRYRQDKGLFTSVEQLMDVSGIGPAKLAELRDWVTVGSGGAVQP